MAFLDTRIAIWIGVPQWIWIRCYLTGSDFSFNLQSGEILVKQQGYAMCCLGDSEIFECE